MIQIETDVPMAIEPDVPANRIDKGLLELMIQSARQRAEQARQRGRDFEAAMKQADDDRDRCDAEAESLTTLLRVWYPGADPEIPF